MAGTDVLDGVAAIGAVAEGSVVPAAERRVRRSAKGRPIGGQAEDSDGDNGG
jgi:hypothetical protein